MRTTTSSGLAWFLTTAILCQTLQPALAEESTELFLPNVSPQFIGWGFHYDPILNSFVKMKPVFAALPPSPVNSNGTTHIDFHEKTLETSSYHASSTQLSLTADVDFLKLAALLATSSESGQSSYSKSISLAWTEDYGNQYINYFTPTAPFTLEADTLRALMDSDLQAQLWREMFGEYVAVAYKSMASVILDVALISEASYSTQSSFADLYGSYSSIFASTDATATIGSLLSEALSEKSLSFSFQGVGVDISQINFPSSVDDYDQGLLLGQIASAMDTSGNRHGLVLVPAGELDGVTTKVSPPSGYYFVIRDAANQVRSAVGTLLRASAYEEPYSYRAFLAQQFTAPGGDSLWNQLEDARNALVLAMDDVWLSADEYLKDTGSTAKEAKLQQATLAVTNANVALDSVRQAIHIYVQTSIPDMNLSVVTENFQGVEGTNWTGFEVVATNVGFFVDGTVEAIERQIAEHLTVYEDTNCSGLPFYHPPTNNSPATVASGWIRRLSIDSIAPAAAPGAEGLLDIVFRFECGLDGCAIEERVALKDHLPGHAGQIGVPF